MIILVANQYVVQEVMYMLPDHITPLKALFDQNQTELRAQENSRCHAKVRDGKLIDNCFFTRSGVFARVFCGGLFGASSNIYDEAGAKKALQRAQRLAKEADSRCRLGEAPIPTIESGMLELDRPLQEMDQAAHIDFAFQIDNYIATRYPNLAHREIRVRTQCTEKRLAVTNGWDAHTAIVRCYVDVDLEVQRTDGSAVNLGNYYGKGGYMSDVFSDPRWLYEGIDQLYRNLMDYREAQYVEAGYHDIILSPDLSGMLSHEAVGHTVEADGVLAGSIAGLRMGEQVASEKVTLMDYANEIPDGEAYCRMLVDDEGTRCRDLTIIKNGILTGLLHSRQTARNLGGEACGCVRGSYYYDEPMIRMRNTAIAPGTDTLEDMIASIDDGYYLVGNENGSGDTNAEFIIVSNLGYRIKNGKIAYPVRGTTISGQAFELLKTVSMVGNKQGWRFGGMCGKKQRIETATGGPAIKCKANLAGK